MKENKYYWDSNVFIAWITDEPRTPNERAGLFSVVKEFEEKKLDLPFDKIVDTVKGLTKEEQEQLFFAINEDYAKALGKMRDEAWKEHRDGKSIPLENLG